MFIPYHTLSLNTSQIHTNPYLSCFISALVELPAYVCSWLVLKKFPRRLSVIACLCLGAVPLFLLQLVPERKSQFLILHLNNFTRKEGKELGYFSTFLHIFILHGNFEIFIRQSQTKIQTRTTRLFVEDTLPDEAYPLHYFKAKPPYIIIKISYCKIRNLIS